MKWISGVFGAVLLGAVLASILRTLVVPRGLYSGLVYRLWWTLRRVLRLAAFRGGYQAIDRAQTWLGSLILMGMLATWLGGAFVGYGLLLHALSSLSWGNSFREAGSSLFTLGFASGQRPRLSAVDFLAATTGPVVIALQIAYLPTLYAAYSRRELEVTLLQSRAGEPAWGPEILARQWLVDTETALPELYRAWERLAADIGESHSTYPVLTAFRSPGPYRNWLVGLLAVMDAAAMQLALAPRAAPPEARLVIRAGFTALRDIARSQRFSVDTDPAPDSPIQLTFPEFDSAVAMVVAAGFPAQRTAREAWPHFHGWRVNYEAAAYELCRRSDAVPALWSGPRDFVATPIPPRRPMDRRPGGSRPEPPAQAG
ncbi:hypothetical protein ACFOZ0_01710 [Streptomyces yaanensis]|uniref:Two pore domain potassium channel family protein n=1 Tax=Streptomyces yaanensis TaxID=1142239 RepID=A0ABV7S7B9_9ACTN|nr:hypothetical protein [Streptomyces sp. CGMCC 4.7035]WNB99615.1 hypothetical protein Q2K21_16925 [Streptomyces sp. CGMCC 4.7035]